MDFRPSWLPDELSSEPRCLWHWLLTHTAQGLPLKRWVPCHPARAARKNGQAASNPMEAHEDHDYEHQAQLALESLLVAFPKRKESIFFLKLSNAIHELGLMAFLQHLSLMRDCPHAPTVDMVIGYRQPLVKVVPQLI